MRHRLALLLVGALLLGGGAGEVAAQETIDLTWSVVAAGVAPSAGAAVTVNATLGQPVIGAAHGGAVSLAAGYWAPGLGLVSAQVISFAAAPQRAAILVTWATGRETGNRGFNLYRAESEAGPRTRLNDALIPTLVPPGLPLGSAYQWLDDDGLAPGQTYTYWLERVDLYGRSALHGPVQAAAPTLHAVYLPLVRR
jgi:hypothetical protein